MEIGTDARHRSIQTSLRDVGNLERGSPTLKRWAIINLSLRDKDQAKRLSNQLSRPNGYYFDPRPWEFEWNTKEYMAALRLPPRAAGVAHVERAVSPVVFFGAITDVSEGIQRIVGLEQRPAVFQEAVINRNSPLIRSPPSRRHLDHGAPIGE